MASAMRSSHCLYGVCVSSSARWAQTRMLTSGINMSAIRRPGLVVRRGRKRLGRVVDDAAPATKGRKGKRPRDRRWLGQGVAEGVVHHFTHREVQRRRPFFRLPEKLV